MTKKEICSPKITDDLLKKIKEYHKHFSKLFNTQTKTKKEKISTLSNIIQEMPKILGSFEDIIKKLLSTKLPKLNYDHIIEGTLGKSLDEIKKKLKDKNFYRQNARAFIETCNVITKHINQNKVSSFDGIVLDLFIKQIKELLNDSYFLMNDIITVLYESDKNLGYKVPFQHTFCMWQSVRQTLYGRGSGFCFTDKEYDGASLGMIRIALENRIRNGFGCFGIIDTKTDSFKPIDLSTIFDYIRPLCPYDVQFILPFRNIERINKWVNIYMHSGFKMYSWLPHIIVLYLHPLFTGDPKLHNLNSGIKIRKNTIAKVWLKIEFDLNKATTMKSKFNIFLKKTVGKYIPRYKLIRYDSEQDIEAFIF